MLDDIVGYLCCPHCGAGLSRDGGVLTCANRHGFDIARQGYVNLLQGGANAGTADTREMLRAREAFLGAGHFEPIAEAVASAVRDALADAGPGPVVEVGAGTGYHLARVLQAAPGRDGIALDLSKHAARIAARAHERIGAVVCDAWARLPLRSGCAAAVIDVFAPRNAAEFRRVLADDGVLVVVTPTPRHLAELVAALGLVGVDADKDERLAEQLERDFERVSGASVERGLVLSADDVAAFVRMGPSAHHIQQRGLQAALEDLETPVVTALSVTVGVYAPR